MSESTLNRSNESVFFPTEDVVFQPNLFNLYIMYGY